MVDICMCTYDKCPLKDSCYRYRAKADTYQTYFIVDDELKDHAQNCCCLEYWPLESEEEIERLNQQWR